MGHELSGIVMQSNTNGIQTGDKVVVEPLITCGSCFACRSGFSYVCQNLGLYGIDAPGGFAEYVAVAGDRVIKIPEDLAFDVAALIEPVAVAVHTVRLSSLKFGDTVCVLGGGPIGLLTALVAGQVGPKQIFVCEKEPFRIQIAREFGFEVIDVNRDDPETVIMDATSGKGVDIVFEVAGAPQTILLSTKLCCVRGEIVQVAMPKVAREVDIVGLTFKELTLKGVRVYAPYDFAKAVHFVANSGVDLSPLLSEPFRLEEAEMAFAKAYAGQEVMRVLFKI
jgi:threonine dehydrogenase-like Zn-dependent dehydrogenase